MSYRLEWNASPNYTPGSQTKAFYGRPRSIDAGAGHWWNTPEAGATHDGVVSIFKNPARQGSAHAVLSAGRVTEMVRAHDTAWTTGSANPYTYSIEVDPRIMWKWQGGVSAAQRKLGSQIFETLAEYLADKRYHNLPWYPHKRWMNTQCNPIPWGEVMIRAKQIRAAKDTPAPKPPAVREVSRQKYSPLNKMLFTTDITLQRIPTGAKADNKVFKKNDEIDIAQLLTMSDGSKWYRTKYSSDNEIGTGFPASSLKQKPPAQPEWIKNLKDINDVKLMVMSASAPIYDLNTGKQVGSPIPQGTWIDIAKQTVVGGKTYLISKYSADNAMPNGILKDMLGVPVPKPEPPKPAPEPEWLKNWQDINDIFMYTRKEHVEVVNLLDGSTTTTIEAKGEKIAIASSTEWMGQKYLITKYSTDKKLPHGIRLVDLDIKPVDPNPTPIPPDPERSVDDIIRENNSLLKQILKMLQEVWNKIFNKE